MNYHIGNMLIYQEFNDSNECPLCRIRNILEKRLTDQYLNESVMEDFQRRLVNERGFCMHHTKMMHARQNKLSLALQHITRLTALKGKLEITAAPKTAAKMAETFEHCGQTCVICDGVEVNMIRYYKTVAEMFCSEPDFKETLQKTNGFCLEHFGCLLKYAQFAKNRKIFRKISDHIELSCRAVTLATENALPRDRAFFIKGRKRNGYPRSSAPVRAESSFRIRFIAASASSSVRLRE